MWNVALTILICHIIVISSSSEAIQQACPCPRNDLNGQRVKSKDSTSVYLVIDGDRYGIPNPKTYNNLFRDWNDITIMNVDIIPLAGGISNGAILAKSPDNDATYLISNGVKRWIVSPEAFKAYHFKGENILVLPKDVVDLIPKGGNLGLPLQKVPCNCPRHDLNGQRLKASNSPSVYLVLDGQRRGIPNEQTYNNLFKDWKDITIMDVNEVALGPNLSDMASLVKAPVITSVYLVSNGVKHGISSEQAFEKYHFSWDKIVVVPKVVIDGVPSGHSIS